MGHNLLSGSLFLGHTGSIKITGSFLGSYVGVGSGLTDIPFGSVYSLDNPGAGRIITTKNSTGNSFEGHPNFTYSEANKTLTVKGANGTTALTITGSQLNNPLRVITDKDANLIYAAGTGMVGIGTGLPTAKLAVSGTLSVSASTNPVYFHGLQPAVLPNTSSYLGYDSSTGRIVLTSSAQGGGGTGGTIGAAEDGDYTDGLYADFTTSTTIGTAVDRFNEVLKILAPSPAPAVRFIDEDIADGSTAKLSFGPSPHVVDTFSNVATAAGHSQVDSNGLYSVSYTGDHKRLGVYDGTQIITGFVNANVDRNETNGYLSYASGAFNNGDSGTLKLEVNGSTLHSVALSGLGGSGNPATGSANSLTANSGFTNVSTNASSFDGNGAVWGIFKHRTAKYKIHTSDQRNGWNYARIIHTVGSTDHTTNYVEWVNDPSGAVNNLAAANPRIENITLAGSKYLSGVRYNTGITANYKVDVQNMYQNVYPASGTPVSFNVTNCSTPSAQAIPSIESNNDRDRILAVTGSLTVNVDNLLSASITAKVSATHPLKNTLTNAGTATTNNGFLMDNRSLASTNLSEKFHDESYRKISSNAYDTQAIAAGNATNWDSTAHMVATGTTGHTDGLIMYNQRLYSPTHAHLPNAGNFSKVINTLLQEPDYSGVSGTRTFYRKIQNTSGAAISDLKISSTKTTSRVISHASAFGTQKIKIYVKNPADTGWMDISQNFIYGSVADGNGALINGASDNVNVASGQNSAVHCVTFGTESVPNSEHIMLKIEADASWTGYVEQLNFQLGASDVSAPTQAPVLDDIVVAGTGVSDAKLSFGSSNGIPNYTAVTGSGIGLSNFDSNVNYGASGDRLGVFNTKSNITGDLNEDVAANGSNYPADAFRDAYTGTLELHINGRKVHEIDLTSTVNAITNDFNANSSGFSVSALDWSKTTDLIPSYTLPYRTGTFQVGANDQDLGWNVAKVIHNLGGSTVTTNYIEWVVDTDANALDKSDIVLNNFNHLDVYYQSGVRYFASQPSASYSYRAKNVYRNVYQDGTAVSFPNTTNCFVNNIEIQGVGINNSDAASATSTLPALNNSANCETKDIHVTGTIVLDNNASIKGGLGLFADLDVTVTSQILHPQKSDLVTTAQSKADFMHYEGVIGSTTLTANEYFGLETYRLQTNAYANQAAVIAGAQTWNSQTSVNDQAGNAPHADGLVTANGYLISPLVIGNAGDTRNVADGGSLQAPPGSPNYSSLTNSTRTYYRYFRNTTGVAKATFTITLYGDANLVAKSGAFNVGSPGANKNINVEVKVPTDPSFTGDDDTSTAWGDCIKPYSNGVQPDVDGVGVYNGGGSDLNQTVGGSGRAIDIQLQQKQIRNNQYFVVKITAHEDWTGYLSRIGITY